MTKNLDCLSKESLAAYKYLKLMEKRELDEAKKILSDDFKMTFPGSMDFTTHEELIDYGKLRQISVFKTFDSFEEVKKNRFLIIYIKGTLFGKSLKGENFNNVRYIDKFIYSKGNFIRQQVWNDFAKNQLLNNIYPLSNANLHYINRQEVKFSLNPLLLDFMFSKRQTKKNLEKLFFEGNFHAILPGNKLINLHDFIFYIQREAELIEKKIYEINLIEKKQYKVIYLDGVISSLNLDREQYKNVRFIERLEFDTDLKKIISYEMWNDLAEHGF